MHFKSCTLLRLCVWLQHLPFFALSNQFFRNLRSTFYQATMVFDNAVTKMMISVQHYTFLPMMLVARFGEPFLPGMHQRFAHPLSSSFLLHPA